MRFEGDSLYYLDENNRIQIIQFIHPITWNEPLGSLGNECKVYTEHAEYHVQWLKDSSKTCVVAVRGPENQWPAKWAVIKFNKYDVESEEFENLDDAKVEFEMSKYHDHGEVLLVQIIDRHRGDDE